MTEEYSIWWTTAFSIEKHSTRRSILDGSCVHALIVKDCMKDLLKAVNDPSEINSTVTTIPPVALFVVRTCGSLWLREFFNFM